MSFWRQFNDKLYSEIYRHKVQRQLEELGITRKERTLQRIGLPKHYFLFPDVKFGHNGLWPDHSLMGKTVLDRIKRKKYVVESVHLHYYQGYYLVLLLRDENGSHGQRWYQNFNSTCELVIKAVEEEQHNLNFLD